MPCRLFAALPPLALAAACCAALPTPALQSPPGSGEENPAGAPPVRGAEPRIGVNLDSIVDWQTQFSFVDVFKTARWWIPQHVPDDGVWDTGEPIDLDPDGWVASLAPGQAAANVFITSQGGNYPAGEYICLYEGQGTIEFRLDAQVVSQAPGRIVVQINPSPDGLTHLRILQTNPNDPIRDIRLIMPGFEETYDTQIFHPAYLESLAGFQVIRFMNWQRTNETNIEDWADRNTPASFSQAVGGGVAVEYMVELANRLDADPWFCMPHRATDDYVTQFATYVRDHLDPGLDVHIEYSNEVWNGIFPQHQYAEQQGLALGLSSDPWEASMRFHSQRSVEIFQIWETVFGGTDRLVRVLGGWHANPFTNGVILDWNDAHQDADALATAPYFGGDLGLSAAQLEQMSVDELLDHVESRLNDPSGIASTMAENTALAQARGLRHLAYEAGQHLAFFEDTSNDAVTGLLIDANRHPRMRDLYDDYLPMWDQQSNGGLLMHFSHVSAYSRYGSWGALEMQTQDPATAPKWLALRDHIASIQPTADVNGDGVVDSSDLFQVLGRWGACGGCPEDLTGDGFVDAADLFAVLGAWG